MNIFITILTFILILLTYLHFMNEFKYVNSFSIYDTEYSSRKDLQKICELKQPFVFNLELQSSDVIDKEQNMCVFDNSNNEYVTIPYTSMEQLVSKDKNGIYYSMNNHDFAKNVLVTEFSELNSFIQPYFSSNNTYDILMGAKDAYTPLQCMKKSGLYLFVKQGSLSLKIHTFDKDLDDSMCLWDVSHNYQSHDVLIYQNQVVYIPTWCYYTMKFDASTIIYSVSYESPTNIIINLPETIVKYLQLQNTEEKVLKTIEIEEDIVAVENEK